MGLIINGTKMGKPYINGIKHNAYIGGKKIWNDAPPSESFGMEVNSGSDSQFILPLKYGSGTAQHNLTIDWGDGDIQETTGTAGITKQYQGLTHTYPVANENYTIKITGTTYLTTAESNSYFGLGFYSSTAGYNDKTNKAKVKKLLSSPDSLISSSMDVKNFRYTYMFSGCTGLTSIPEKLLPATTLANNCYYHLFEGCTGLTSIPEKLLPATTLANECYSQMFNGCTGLTSIPEKLLPATTLADYCYSRMFYNCTGLTSIPNNLLPATTLVNNCYQYMFYGCTGLTNIGNIDASWFSGKTAQTNMFTNDTKIATPITYANIPTGWK
jgi:hypothetical protein